MEERTVAECAARVVDPNTTTKYFFDTQTGLLLRELTTVRTILAPLPEQVDFEDYRDVDGIKLPFTIPLQTLLHTTLPSVASQRSGTM